MALLAALISVFLAIQAACSPIVVIQPTEVGVIFNRLAGTLDTPLYPGTHFVNPLTNDITIYPIDVQNISLFGPASADDRSAVPVTFADGVEASIDVTILYAIDPALANQVHYRWQNRYEADFLVPTIHSVIRNVTLRYDAEAIYTGSRRAIEADVREELSDAMRQEGLVLTDAIIRNIAFSDTFATQLELTQIAQQTPTASAP